MNALVKITAPVFVVDPYRLRSELLDAFAKAEIAVAEVLSSFNHQVPETPPFGHRLEAAKKIPASSRLSKFRRQVLIDNFERLSALLPIRADIVHSCMMIFADGDQIHLIFQNTNTLSSKYPNVRMIGIEPLKQLTKEVFQIADRIKSTLTQPAPHPPKLAAATGP